MVDSVCERWLEGFQPAISVLRVPVRDAAPYPGMCGLCAWMFRSRRARGWIIADPLLLGEATHTDKMVFRGGNGPHETRCTRDAPLGKHERYVSSVVPYLDFSNPLRTPIRLRACFPLNSKIV